MCAGLNMVCPKFNACSLDLDNLEKYDEKHTFIMECTRKTYDRRCSCIHDVDYCVLGFMKNIKVNGQC